MGRAKAIDEADLQEVLSLRDDFGVLLKDSAQMQTQVSKLQRGSTVDKFQAGRNFITSWVCRESTFGLQ